MLYKKRITLPAIFLLLCCFINAQVPQEHEPIYKSYFDFQSSLIDRDAEDFMNVIDSDSKDYLRKIRKLALFGKPESVKKLDSLTMYYVLLCRATFSWDELSNDSEKLFIEKMFDKCKFPNSKKYMRMSFPYKIQITGNKAKAFLAVVIEDKHGKQVFYKASDKPVVFTREEGKWKINFASNSQIGFEGFKIFFFATDGNINEEMLSLVSFIADKKIGKSIWEPIKPDANNKQKFDAKKDEGK